MREPLLKVRCTHPSVFCTRYAFRCSANRLMGRTIMGRFPMISSQYRTYSLLDGSESDKYVYSLDKMSYGVRYMLFR
jgi:hypothetical protein